MTGTELVRRASLADKLTYAQELAKSGLLPMAYRQQPANVLYAADYGEMLGLAPLAAINGLHIIEGKPTASSGMVSALVRRAGHRLRSGYDATKRVGWCEIVRHDDPDFTYRCEWSVDRAVAANLCTIRDGRPYSRDSKGKPKPWERFPEAMMKARAITECARDACEEALNGVHYTPEELGADVDEAGEPIKVTAERADQPSAHHDDEVSTSTQWDNLLARRSGNFAAIRDLYQQALQAGADADVIARIKAAGDAAFTATRSTDEPVDAEVVEEPTAPAPVADMTGAEPAANQAQLTAVAAALGEHDVKERHERLAVVSFLVGDRIASSAQLTKSEASSVLDTIARLAADGQMAATVAAAIEAAAQSTPDTKEPA